MRGEMVGERAWRSAARNEYISFTQARVNGGGPCSRPDPQRPIAMFEPPHLASACSRPAWRHGPANERRAPGRPGQPWRQGGIFLDANLHCQWEAGTGMAQAARREKRRRRDALGAFTSTSGALNPTNPVTLPDWSGTALPPEPLSTTVSSKSRDRRPLLRLIHMTCSANEALFS